MWVCVRFFSLYSKRGGFILMHYECSFSAKSCAIFPLKCYSTAEAWNAIRNRGICYFIGAAVAAVTVSTLLRCHLSTHERKIRQRRWKWESARRRRRKNRNSIVNLYFLCHAKIERKFFSDLLGNKFEILIRAIVLTKKGKKYEMQSLFLIRRRRRWWWRQKANKQKGKYHRKEYMCAQGEANTQASSSSLS